MGTCTTRDSGDDMEWWLRISLGRKGKLIQRGSEGDENKASGD